MSDSSDPRWRVIGEERHPGPLTMALEEVAAETAVDGGPATVRVYRWPDTLSLGVAQDAASVDWGFCRREGIGVTRRQTGGGGIYHDAVGDISYSVVAPSDAVAGDLLESYRDICDPVFDALAALGVDADFVEGPRDEIYEPACYLRGLNPAHDVVGPDGRKLSGNAQYRPLDAVVQHGSISFTRRAERHCDCFDAALDPDAFRERVGAIDDYADVTRAEAVDALLSSLASWADAEEGSWTSDELDRARALADAKYGAESWVRHREG
ncbi:lipoate-protein ligase A [Halarchaeum rubridurum]|uniref:Lipoate-protein ligase A n=1 Tax=Halarchaeum rubridurum TaxID=489911 RepID=A0A830FQG9_9EURY|nr:biotin/lipoate A/B protein ligase family protein [Halarchaeum rubridurum]MBP1954431.1 lipoate-protein ligase A [Halarchaeum rubridurum]GGM60946.1 lipoprotein lipase [Halarchaeum rubridurum]